MAALFDACDSFANIMTVFNYGVSVLNVTKSNFVTNGNGVQTFNFNCFVILHYPTGQGCAFFNTFDNDYTYAVFRFMNEKIGSCQYILLWLH